MRKKVLNYLKNIQKNNSTPSLPVENESPSILQYFLLFVLVLSVMSIWHIHYSHPSLCEPNDPNWLGARNNTGDTNSHPDEWKILIDSRGSAVCKYNLAKPDRVVYPSGHKEGVGSYFRASDVVEPETCVHNAIYGPPARVNPQFPADPASIYPNVPSPLDQFHIRDLMSINAPILANLRVSLTNIGLYLTVASLIALAFNSLAINYNKIVANSWSISQESIYATVHSIVINQINAIKGQVYFPFIYALFTFILINNLIGMVPYSFASTSHFILTFYISFTVVLGATILGFIIHGLRFFSLFVPSGCPLGLLPLLVLIEFISYLARNVSLGLRLAANVLSGHMLLNILSGFAYNIMTSGFVYFFVGLIPLAFIIAFSGLELGIAFIQAQVFVVLTSSYIKDALDLH